MKKTKYETAKEQIEIINSKIDELSSKQEGYYSQIRELRRNVYDLYQKQDILQETVDKMENSNLTPTKEESEPIKSQITMVNSKIFETNTQIDNYYKKVRELDSLLLNLYNQRKNLQEIILLSEPPEKSNSTIDLRTKDQHDYLIYIHNTKKLVGNISYRGYHCSEYLGDVGYSISSEFRGNGYAYQALILLGEKLYEEGITDFWITVYDDNIPSIRTIEKYGGELIKQSKGVLLFQCHTRKRGELNKPKNSRI